MNKTEIHSKVKKTKLPFVVIKSAQSLDGKIATSSGNSKWITSVGTRAFARKRRNNFDAILVGINTVLKDNPSLDAGSSGKGIKKVILDTRLRISPNAKLFKGVDAKDCIIATSTLSSVSKRGQLLKKGLSIIVCPHKNGKINLKWLLKRLVKEDIFSVLVEGGAHVIGSFLKAGLVDMAHIYIAPRIFGDAKALNSVEGLSVLSVNKTFILKDIRTRKLNPDILVEGYVYRNR